MGIDFGDNSAEPVSRLQTNYTKAASAPPVRAQIMMVKVDSILVEQAIDAISKNKSACANDITGFKACQEELDHNGFNTMTAARFILLQACVRRAVKNSIKDSNTSTMDLLNLGELQTNMDEVRKKLETRCSKTGNLQERLQPLLG